MHRRNFLKSTVTVALAGELARGKAEGKVPAHLWGKYEFGPGPQVTDRLNQGPFPQYPPDAVIPNDDVVMTTTRTDEVVPNYGKGLITYITADSGTDEIKSDNIPQAIEDLVKLPLGQQLYIRPTWREVQPRPGSIQLPDYLKLVFDLAKKNNKRIGLRIQMCAPDYTHNPALPDFVLEKVPKVDLVLADQEESTSAQRYLINPHSKYQPRYDHPVFQQAFKELVGALAAEFDGNPQIEFIDTFMYGFWGEGHTWPFANNPFPDYMTAERTWVNMLELQLENFKKTHLLTNTQPDFSRVGNSELLDRTVRSNNWIRSDTIFIENEQIEALSNRPPWIGALLEQGLPGKLPDPTTAQSVQLAFDEVKPPAPKVVDRQEEKDVEVQIPIKVRAIAPATSVSLDGAMLSLHAPDGQDWSSGWNRVGQHLFPEHQGFNSTFAVKKAFFEHVKSTPVHANISLALSTFQNGETKRIVATSGEFRVPGLGFCAIVQGYASDSLRCRYAFATPTVLTTASSSEMPCPFTSDGAAPPGLISRDWSGSSASDPVSPVGTRDIYFWKWEGNTDTKSSPSLCPGTSLIFSMQEAGPQIRKEIEIDGIKIEDYRVSNVVRFSFGR